MYSFIKEIDKVASDYSCCPTDGYSHIMKICDSAKEMSQPCDMCNNAKIDARLTDKNDYSSCILGDSAEGLRMMLSSGWGRPLRIELQEYDVKNGWLTYGIYFPKFCPNCGRKIVEYESS